MYRNIILCADGTGNKGGHTPDSNVFKTYNAVDIKDASRRQITYYDNGVGTSTNRFLKAISGALGFGFQDNVRELYAFLAKNYREGDKVYIFGFSRGAATIRAFNGFVHDCGLIEPGEDYNDVDLKDEIDALLKAYLKIRYKKKKGEKPETEIADDLEIEGCTGSRRKVKIEFIGVWDTVAALGMPKNTDLTGCVSKAVDGLFNQVDKIVNSIIHHRAYNFELTPNITRACHALSIDDARTSFWPLIWDEVKAEAKGVTVDQVWFAGVHSDVGGGYPRQDMSNVPLLWVLEQAMGDGTGLKLNKRAMQELRDRANIHDKIHDSRDGFGLFYRYHPREIETLCQKKHKAETNIKVHESVLSRLYYRTAGYAPLLLPSKFEVVHQDATKKLIVESSKYPAWKEHREYMNKSVKNLKELYVYQMFVSFFVIVSVIYAWNLDIDIPEIRTGFRGTFADILQYFLPNMFNNSIELWVYQQPSRFLGLLILVGLWWITRRLYRISVRTNAIGQRKTVINEITEEAKKDESGEMAARMPEAEAPADDRGSPKARYFKAFAAHIVFGSTVILIVVYLVHRAIMG
jgi:uncharacterized protein (DUF2235 family)